MKFHLALAAFGLSLTTFSSAASAAVMTTYSLQGNVGVEVTAFPSPDNTSADTGILNLSGIPTGATIERAILYGNNFANSTTPSAIFNGTNLGSTTAFDADTGFTAYQWDVTSLIAGNGSFTASYSDQTNSYGLALVVVYSDPSLPLGQVIVNDGATNLVAPETVSTTIDTVAGTGNLWIHTLADGNESSGEEIRFNGAVEATPLDGNLGPFASLFSLPVTTLNGTNTVEISSPNEDAFGWDLAVLYTEEEQSVPEPNTAWGLAALLGLMGCLKVRGQKRARATVDKSL